MGERKISHDEKSSRFTIAHYFEHERVNTLKEKKVSENM